MTIKRCPTHGDSVDAWPCPDDCLDFAMELERRVEDVQVNGNYFKHLGSLTDGEGLVQEYRNHVPVGPPRPIWSRP